MTKAFRIAAAIAIIGLFAVTINLHLQVQELTVRVQDVENAHTTVLQSCRTTGQVCREILARLTGGRDVQQK